MTRYHILSQIKIIRKYLNITDLQGFKIKHKLTGYSWYQTYFWYTCENHYDVYKYNFALYIEVKWYLIVIITFSCYMYTNYLNENNVCNIDCNISSIRLHSMRYRGNDIFSSRIHTLAMGVAHVKLAEGLLVGGRL